MTTNSTARKRLAEGAGMPAGVSVEAVEAAWRAFMGPAGEDEDSMELALTAALPLLGQDEHTDDCVSSDQYDRLNLQWTKRYEADLAAALDRATRAEAERDEFRERVEVLADLWGDSVPGDISRIYAGARVRDILASVQAESEVDRG